MSDEKPLRYEVTYLDLETGQRKLYGCASDQSGADALVGSIKAQNIRYREIQIRKYGIYEL